MLCAKDSRLNLLVSTPGLLVSLVQFQPLVPERTPALAVGLRLLRLHHRYLKVPHRDRSDRHRVVAQLGRTAAAAVTAARLRVTGG